jgi:hypothetical protein
MNFIDIIDFVYENMKLCIVKRVSKANETNKIADVSSNFEQIT